MAVDRHRLRPLCCQACGRPMSVAEKMVGVVCTWDAYMKMREDFGDQAFWISESNSLEAISDVAGGEVIVVDPFRLFGIDDE